MNVLWLFCRAVGTLLLDLFKAVVVCAALLGACWLVSDYMYIFCSVIVVLCLLIAVVLRMCTIDEKDERKRHDRP